MTEETTQVRPPPPPPPPEERLASGTIIGDVRLGSVAGGGLSSEVFAGEHLVAHKRCAVKVMRPQLEVRPVARGRYVHEARSVAELAIAGIADVFSFGNTPSGRTYAVGEWVMGQNLRELIRQSSPLPRRTFQPILQQLCVALAAVHAQGFAHRRLHGGNVMVGWTEDGAPKVKLLDFGVWRLHPRVEEPAPVHRTAEHAICVAPEIAKGGEGDQRSDVYALAVLLYEMLTGKVPFLGEGFRETLEQHVSEPVLPPSQMVAVPRELEEIIVRGLEKDPRKRLPSVEALLSALDPAWITGQHPTVPRGRIRALNTGELRLGEVIETTVADGRVARPLEPKLSSDAALRLPLRRPRWLLVVLALALLLVGGAIAFLLLAGDDEPQRGTAAHPATPERQAVRRTAPPPSVRSAAPGAQAAPPPRTAPPPDRAPARPSPPPPPLQPAPAPPQSATQPDSSVEPTRAALDPARTVANLAASPMLPAQQLQQLTQRQYGGLKLVGSSPQTQFFLDGKFVGQGPERLLRRVPVGRHRVHVVVDGASSRAREVELLANQQQVIVF